MTTCQKNVLNLRLSVKHWGELTVVYDDEVPEGTGPVEAQEPSDEYHQGARD